MLSYLCFGINLYFIRSVYCVLFYNCQLSCQYPNGRHLCLASQVASTISKSLDVLTHLVLSHSGGVIHFLNLYPRLNIIRVSQMARKWDLNSDGLTSIHVPNDCAIQPPFCEAEIFIQQYTSALLIFCSNLMLSTYSQFPAAQVVHSLQSMGTEMS